MQSNTTHMQTIEATLDGEMFHAIDGCVAALNASKINAAQTAIATLINDSSVRVTFDDSTIFVTMPEAYINANVAGGMTTSDIIRDCLIRGARLLIEARKFA